MMIHLIYITTPKSSFLQCKVTAA